MTVLEIQQKEEVLLRSLGDMSKNSPESKPDGWDAAKEELRKLGEQKDFALEREAMEKRLISAQLKDEDATRAKHDAEKAGEKRMSYDEVFNRYLIRGQNATLSQDEMRVLETRGTSTQITTTNSLGGYAVPQSFSNNLEAMGLWAGGMMEACQIYTDTIGGTLKWPTADDTGNTGEIVGQGAARNVIDYAFGNVLFIDYTIDSGIIKIGNEFLRDERVNFVNAVLAEQLSARLSRKTNTVLTNGTGTSEPYGLTVASTSLGVTTASATAITGSELVNHLYSVDKYYSSGAKVAWMMHRSVLAYLRTLDFTTNTTHLFADRVIAGEPEMLLGYPVIINNDLPATSANAPVAATKHIYFGDFSKYVIRKIGDVTIDRNDSVYWANNTAGFMGRLSLDGNLLNNNAIKALKTHA